VIDFDIQDRNFFMTQYQLKQIPNFSRNFSLDFTKHTKRTFLKPPFQRATLFDLGRVIGCVLTVNYHNYLRRPRQFGIRKSF